MNYFVVADDGNKYGPADIATLNQWVLEGRVTPSTTLQNEATGEMVRAQSVSGLTFPDAPAVGGVAAGMGAGMGSPGMGGIGTEQPGMGPSGYAQNPYAQAPGYPRAMGGPQPGQDDVNWAWIWFALSFVCCGFFGNIFGLLRANKAMEMGHPGANAPRVANIVVLGLQVLYIIFVFAVVLPAMVVQGATGR